MRKWNFSKMGSCPPVPKNPNSTMKFRRYFGCFARSSKVKQDFNGDKIESPTELNSPPTLSEDKDIGSSSRDVVFFDSRPWLDSDCDDDFFSVNGDFTPSRGSTPNYQKGVLDSPRPATTMLFASLPRTPSNFSPSPSPSPGKKLLDLFLESPETQETENEENLGQGQERTIQASLNLTPKSTKRSPLSNYIHSVERTPDIDAKSEKDEVDKTAQCCLPRLVPKLTLSERKSPSSGLNLNSSKEH